MSERWFRFYDGVPDDPKALKLSDKQYRAWTFLLCIASRYEGEIANDLEDAAIIMRTTVAKLRLVMLGMVRLELFEETETGYVPHNWNARQFKSDVSTDRVRALRERKRNVSSAVSETRSEDRVQKTETEKKEDTPSSLRSEVPQIAKPIPDLIPEIPECLDRRPSRKKPRTAMPEDWPTRADFHWAVEHWRENGRADLVVQIKSIAAQCCDHHAKLDSRFADWSAAWRTWVRNAMSHKFAPKEHGNGRRESPHEQTERVARELIAECNARDAAGDHGRDREARNPLPGLLTYDPGIAPGMDRDAVSGSGAQVPRRAAIRG